MIENTLTIPDGTRSANHIRQSNAAFSAISQRANAAIDAAREAVGQGLDASAVTSAGVNAWEV